MNADHEGLDQLGGACAIKWLEASASLGPRRFFLMDGKWYEIGAQYVSGARDEIGRLFAAAPTLDLPAWSLVDGGDEGDYNEFVPDARPGYLCLDCNKRVRDPLGPGRASLEICDLLGPDNELIHVKRAKGSAPLSHLFSQGLVSAQTLLTGPPEVKRRFTETVAALPKGRALPPDFVPKKVVYAILLENGHELTADTLFPFSQVTLAHAARILQSYQIEVEVIGIPAA